MQFAMARPFVVPAAEAMVRQAREDEFRRCVYDAAGGDVPADHRALPIGDGDVEVRSVGRYRSLEREDLEGAFEQCRSLCIRETDRSKRQAADARYDEGGLDAVMSCRRLDRLPEIAAGVESQWEECGRFWVHVEFDHVSEDR